VTLTSDCGLAEVYGSDFLVFLASLPFAVEFYYGDSKTLTQSVCC
jgi:hypothetical protein